MGENTRRSGVEAGEMNRLSQQLMRGVIPSAKPLRHGAARMRCQLPKGLRAKLKLRGGRKGRKGMNGGTTECRGFVTDSVSYYAGLGWEAVGGQGKVSQLGDALVALQNSLQEQLRSVSDVVDIEIAPEVLEKGNKLLSLLDSYVSRIELSDPSTIPVGEAVALSAFAAVALKVLQQFKFGDDEVAQQGAARGTNATTSAAIEDVLPLYYDPEAAERYFSKRKGLVLKRVFKILFGSAEFLISLKTEGQDVSEGTRQKQAVQLRELLTFLGPTFVKAGQALSIRVDLLPEVYLKELRKLQDAVPPFPTAEAYEILHRELASRGGVRGVFESITPEPVASASLGQVYRGKLKGTGEEVAIKVQRPNILPSIALDLHILRIIAPIFQQYKELNSDIVALVDQWGSRFVAELDYLREAENGKQFMEAMKARKISSVTSATPVDEFCTSNVLITNWIYGERLEESTEEDVAKLCGLALTAYLTMLLDTGVLHADPHPGNLLRTDDVAAEVQYIQTKYGNIFQIPPYFAYILRAFSVLEGIGLQNDPKYAIVQECYPYIARRLFSDNSPRVKSALR